MAATYPTSTAKTTMQPQMTGMLAAAQSSGRVKGERRGFTNS